MILLGFIVQTAQSQNTNLPSYQQDGVQITGNFADCNNPANGTHKQYVLITVTNENTFPVSVAFKKNLWYNGACLSCDSESNEYKVSIEVEANSSVSGQCSESNGLRVFSKMLNLDKVRKLTNYELIDLNVQEDE